MKIITFLSAIMLLFFALGVAYILTELSIAINDISSTQGGFHRLVTDDGMVSLSAPSRVMTPGQIEQERNGKAEE